MTVTAPVATRGASPPISYPPTAAGLGTRSRGGPLGGRTWKADLTFAQLPYVGSIDTLAWATMLARSAVAAWIPCGRTAFVATSSSESGVRRVTSSSNQSDRNAIGVDSRPTGSAARIRPSGLMSAVGRTQPRLPPFGAENESSEFFLATTAKLTPARMALASCVAFSDEATSITRAQSSVVEDG